MTPKLIPVSLAAFEAIKSGMKFHSNSSRIDYITPAQCGVEIVDGVFVPRVPTEKMLDAAVDAYQFTPERKVLSITILDNIKLVYAAMLAAAQGGAS